MAVLFHKWRSDVITIINWLSIIYAITGSSYAGWWWLGPPGTLKFHPALKLILRLNTQDYSVKVAKWMKNQ